MTKCESFVDKIDIMINNAKSYLEFKDMCR